MLSAAVVEPVGRKANWSLKLREGGGVRKAGYIKSRVIILSIILVLSVLTESVTITAGESFVAIGVVQFDILAN